MSAATAAPGAVPQTRSLASRGYGAFALRRTGQAVVVILLAYVLVFLVLAALPGDPVQAQLDNPESGYSDAEKAEIIAYHGLDKPIPVQLLIALGNLLRGDLGTSLSTHVSVSSMLASALPSTLALAGSALVIALGIALVLGYLSQRLPAGPLRTLVRSLPTAFLSTPNFLIGLILIQVLSVQIGLFSVLDPNGAISTLVASLTLAIPVSAQITQVFISGLDGAREQEFTAVATSRGLSPTGVFARHLVRPALLPTVTVTGLTVGELLGGSLITETIFGRAGIGTVVQKAVAGQDVPVLLATVTFSAAVFVIVNLVIDLVYPLIDPRLRTKEVAA